MMKTWIPRIALCAAVLIGAAACSPQDLKAIWDRDGVDYSQKSEQDINIEAFYWTLWHDEQAQLNRFKDVLDDGALARLRACESGGNYQIVAYSGGFYGAYQFSQSTWNSVANRHYGGQYAGVRPDYAPAAWQDAFTRALYSEMGRSPWPVCGRRI
jgi:hypothetical protein